MAKQDSHIQSEKSPSKGMPSENDAGGVTQKHRLKLGEADGVNNPNGVGEPSKVSSIANGGGKRW